MSLSKYYSKRRYAMLFTTVFAEGTAAAPQAAGQVGTAGMVASLLPFLIMILFMYLILIRPQKKKEKALREKISKMAVGDKVVTIGGIAGKVSRIKDEFVIIETGSTGNPAERSFIKFERSAIKDVQTKISN